MGSDYSEIKRNNIVRYGTEIGRIGQMLLADRYDDRTHFIFELLQNAEDALARRAAWNGSRAIEFSLSASSLRVSHWGLPFSEADVRGVCGIDESTKDLTSIGRFGIGFKSVYAFADRPEIHSGDEHFAIGSYVWPEQISPIALKPEETRFILPFRENDVSAPKDIAKGLQRLGPRILLFLREIEEISWSVDAGPSGFYVRGKPERIAENARRITVIGQDHGADAIEENWLIFSREVNQNGKKVGYAEIAFQLREDKKAQLSSVQPIKDSVLVVFFPTIVATNTGFLVQGPYRTTPSRDNVPYSNPWNQYLAKETGILLAQALRSLRDQVLLNADALRTLPIDRQKFGEESLLSPLFDATREVLNSEALIPRFGGGHVAAKYSRLARNKELRELLDPSQLTELFETDKELGWISEEITQDRTPELRQYLMHELGVEEVRPDDIVHLFTKEFLEKQTDAWVVQLYEFLNSQPALLRHWSIPHLPLVRLEDGSHVKAVEKGQWQAFLPGAAPTSFPTVRRSVCGTEETRKLLHSLGLTEPDPVDDVIRNVLPRYEKSPLPSGPEYAVHIGRILNAFKTDSKRRRDALVSTLRDCRFLAAVDAATGKKCFAKPTGVYIATERLRGLFAGVPGVLLVDSSYECLRGEDVRELLEGCGATRYLELKAVEASFTWGQRAELRRNAGCEASSGGERIEDFTVRGLDELLNLLPTLDAALATEKANLLWEALCDLEDRSGKRAFSGNYSWSYYKTHSCQFDAAFVRRLNGTPWLVNSDGELQPPSGVLFEETGWKENKFLLSKIFFRPPIIETLAKEAGIEPGVLDLLKKLGVTSEAELKARLGIAEENPKQEAPSRSDQLGSDDTTRKPRNTGEPGTPLKETPMDVKKGMGTGSAPSHAENGEGSGADLTGSRHAGTAGSVGDGQRSSRASGESSYARSSGAAGGRDFVSYVGAHPGKEDPDPDGVDHERRLALEEQAITLVLAQEPKLKRTPTNNPGFDLVELGQDDEPARWIEIKAMTGDLQGRPVGLTRSEFETAQERGDRYWLYVVEKAGFPEEARIVRIQDPAGKARTFTFDRGWLSVAEP